jgi:hypothetical protein
MKPVLKLFVNHKRNITKYRALSKQQQVLAVAGSSSVATLDNATSYSTWFANKRVWFAEDSARVDTSSSRSSRQQTTTKTPPEAVGWSQKAASAIALSGFVALGAFMVHQVVATTQRK